MSNKQFKPMLAYTIEDTSKIQYPCYVSVKLDGIRAVVLDGVVYSRSMKPIRSKVVQAMFGKQEYNGFDGELLYGDWNAPNVFNLTTQAVMSENLKEGLSKENITFAVFDDALGKGDFDQRLLSLEIESNQYLNYPSIVFLKQTYVQNEQELLTIEKEVLEDGYEGLIVKLPNSPYKQGRSTAKEGYTGKLKRFSQKEARVIGFEEKMHNTNAKTTNELGYSERSMSKDGMEPAGTLGALVCEVDGITFTCGSGFDDATRQEVWDNRDKYFGKLITFKYFEIGMKDSFRFPIFLGFRDEDDMS